MDTNALSLLVEIVDTGNLSQAARKLKMTAPTSATTLTQLEKSLGVQLIKRTTRRAEPTEVGLRLTSMAATYATNWPPRARPSPAWARSCWGAWASACPAATGRS